MVSKKGFKLPAFNGQGCIIVKNRSSEDPNKYRAIHHLSFPGGNSLNDQITEEICSVEYASFEDAILLVRQLGPNALLAKQM